MLEQVPAEFKVQPRPRKRVREKGIVAFSLNCCLLTGAAEQQHRPLNYRSIQLSLYETAALFVYRKKIYTNYLQKIGFN